MATMMLERIVESVSCLISHYVSDTAFSMCCKPMKVGKYIVF